MKEFNYTTYSKMVKTIFGEELERMQEYLYCITNDYDDSEDKPWVVSSDQNIPTYYDMQSLYNAEQSLYNAEQYIEMYLEGKLSDEGAEEVEMNIRTMYYQM